MRPTIVFGRIGGIPVGAHWSALAGVGLIAVLLATTVLPVLAPGRDATVDALAAGASDHESGLLRAALALLQAPRIGPR